MSNPLLSLSFALPFDTLQPEHVEPAIKELIETCEQRLLEFENVDEELTYDNTMKVFDTITRPLDIAFEMINHLEGVATTPEFRDAYNAIVVPVSSFYASIPLRKGLWNRLHAYSETDEAKSLTGESARFVHKVLEDFKRAGAELDDDKKKRLLEVNQELSSITTTYKQNVLDSTNAYELLVTDASTLSGLPESAISAAAASAKAKGKEGYRFTLQAPSILPVFTYADNRDLRKTLYTELVKIATSDPYDNEPLMKKILSLRAEKARLLGYDNFGDLVTEDRMAGSVAVARSFIETLHSDVAPFIEQEHAELTTFAQEKAGFEDEALEPWDLTYYAEKLKQDSYAIDQEMLRPYFESAAVLEGMFTIASTLFDVQIEQDISMPVWHDDVTAYRLSDADGVHRCTFYVDLYPRESKRAGAWMNRLIVGGPTEEGFEPHLGLMCCNFTPPVGDTPSLLTHTEVTTLFHEFGHLLHQALSTVETRSLSGVDVAWDFVELPSQLLENWCWHEESLSLFAKHYETGEPLPAAYLDRMQKARFFRTASFFSRQIGFAMMDFTSHMDFDPESDESLVAFARSILQKYSVVRVPEYYARINSFTHIFAGPIGYATGYYSYAWAEVLEADAFARFEEEGILNPETGKALEKTILSKGNSEDPKELFRAFLKRDPDTKAVLRRAGLLQK